MPADTSQTQAERIAEAADRVAAEWPAFTDTELHELGRIMAGANAADTAKPVTSRTLKWAA